MNPPGPSRDLQKSAVGVAETPDEKEERPVPPPVPPALPGTPRPLPSARGRFQKVLLEWWPKDSREIEHPRIDGPFINIIPLDNWQHIALLAGPYGGLALWVLCSPSRRGLVAAGARMHRVRGYIAPRKKSGVL